MEEVANKKKIPDSYTKIFPFLLLISTLFMSVGYASLNSITADITGDVLANAQYGVFITDVTYDSNNGADTVNSKIRGFYESTLNSRIVLSEDDNTSYITYKVTIYNSTNDIYAFDNVKYMTGEQTYDNENISFELIGLDNMTLLQGKESITFSIKFYYKEIDIDNNILNSYLNFSFKKAHSINYINIDNGGFPIYVLDGSNLVIDFSENKYLLSSVSIGGNKIDNFTYESGILTIPNVTGNVEITALKNKLKIFNKEFDIITDLPTLTLPSKYTDDKDGLYVSTKTNGGLPTYYFRGNVEDNYVDFAGFEWRVLRVNEDGTIRLIMHDGINENTGYQFKSNPHDINNMYYSYDSNAKIVLEDWYNTNIVEKKLADRVVKGNFCEQAKILGGSDFTSGNAVMIDRTIYEPTFECKTDGNGYGLFSANIGMLTYDEIFFAGASSSKNNDEYFLYNVSDYFWLLSPAGFNSGNYARVWYSSQGVVLRNGNVNAKLSLRPVINVKADVTVTGSGTADDHWIIQ